LNNVKKKYPASTAGQQAKNIIAKWKSSCATNTSSSSLSASNSSSNLQSVTTTSSSSVAVEEKKESSSSLSRSIVPPPADDEVHEHEAESASSPRVHDFDITGMLKKLPEARLKVK
jgi:hypothetical protein